MLLDRGEMSASWLQVLMLRTSKRLSSSSEASWMHPETSRSMSMQQSRRGARLVRDVHQVALSRLSRGHDPPPSGRSDRIDGHLPISRSISVAPHDAAAGVRSSTLEQWRRLSVSSSGQRGRDGTRSSSCCAQPLRSRCRKRSPQTSRRREGMRCTAGPWWS